MIRISVRLFKLKRGDRFTPDLLIDDGYSLANHGLDAQVWHIPGHSNGSIGILTSHGDFLCGDLLKNIRHPAPGFGIFDHVEFEATIEKLKSLNIRTVYPGHGRPFAWEQFINNHRRKASRNEQTGKRKMNTPSGAGLSHNEQVQETKRIP